MLRLGSKHGLSCYGTSRVGVIVRGRGLGPRDVRDRILEEEPRFLSDSLTLTKIPELKYLVLIRNWAGVKRF